MGNSTNATTCSDAVTLKKIQEAAHTLEQTLPPRRNSLFEFPYGLKVYEAPPPPAKLKLRDDLDIFTDGFRAEMNAWLLAQFGLQQPLLEPNTVLISETYGMVVMRREDIAKLSGV